MTEHQLKVRSRWMQFFLMLGLTILIVRLLYIQVFHSEAWAKDAAVFWRGQEKVEAVRGTIYDRNGKKLAYTTVAYDVEADLSEMKAAKAAEVEKAKKKPAAEVDLRQGDPRIYAQQLAPLLKVPEEKIYETLTTPDRIGVRIKQTVDSDTAEKIQKLGLKGIHLTKTTTRHYPNNTMAAHLLGFVTKDGKGGAGIELQYDHVLRGEDGLRKFMKDSRGNPLPYEQQQIKPAVDGKDVWLTIDETVQQYAEDALDHLIEKFKPENASITVVDPNTGEILAMANRPTFNPNKFWEADPKALYNNRAVNTTFEPGSTFKIVTMTAALAEKKVSLDETFTSGQIKVKGSPYFIRDWNWYKGARTLTFRQGVEQSSNVGMVLLGQRLGWETLYDYIYKFGFNQKTGVDLPGEGNSILFDSKQKTDLNLAVTSFGQGIAVTPMQQIAAVSAVANGGQVMRPFVMKEIRDPKTEATLQEQKPHVISQVANPEVMAAMREIMEGVVKSDESKAGYIEGYRIAGKTGTAQIPKDTGGYETDRFVCSFIGFAPADQPKVLVYVTVDSPKNDLQFGNIVATPFAKEVFANVLPYIGLKAQVANPAKPEQSAAPVKYVSAPNLVGMTRGQAEKTALANSLKFQIVGRGDKIAAQWPKPGAKVLAGSSTIVIADNFKDANGNVQVPDLTGESMREAIEILSMLELVADASGSGFVVSQEPKGGSIVPSGTKIRLTLGAN
ncbi:penicillin-binding transpeptidase domain-containing protein [Effusibacillus lacus]|uniref:PASTA domain-containing protein n=1 Tax=Effusibacillus lacus TaxID=1348429 RepID=A0A292YE39_9BACL|nr:penicillin-binding transpeptidase domain-containing protein [Effusibacillus lacus]TCS75692.1 stage V sporulation protein D (sporulation-specific penicillin-binding protein) [Effusibacillus lacus]GAX91012.1 hypothetical protein EFBL_2672 [Effusibacillus lacus]